MKIQGCRWLSTVALTIALGMGLVQASQAAVYSTYTDESDFLSNVFLPVDTDDFDDLVGGFLYASPLSRSVASYGYDATATGDFTAISRTTPTSFTWLTSVVGSTVIDFAVTSGTANAIGGNFFLTDISGNLVEGLVTVTVNGGESPLTVTTSSSSNFFGWVSGTPITSVEFTPAAGTFATVDNLTFAVPEPSTYAMLGMGACCASLGVMRRRRQTIART